MRRSKAAVLVTVMLLVAASCGDDDDDSGGGGGTGTGTGRYWYWNRYWYRNRHWYWNRNWYRYHGGGGDAEGALAARGPIDIWLSNNAEEKAWGEAMVDAWNADNPDEQISAQEIPAGETSEVVIAAAITAGNAPCLIFNTAPAAVPQFQKAGGLVALDGFEDGAAYVTERSGERAEQYRSPDGNLYQMPWKANPVMIFYNKEMFTAAGLDPENPPLSTYDEFLATSRTLVSDGGAQAAIWPAPTSQFFQNWFDFYPMYIAASGKQLVEDGEATFAIRGGLRRRRLLADDVRRGARTPRGVHRGLLRRRPGGDVDRRAVGDRRVRRQGRLGRRSRAHRRGHAGRGDPDVQRREVDRHVHRL